MKLKPVLHKATEFGIGLTAIATLILAGCGGGASSTVSPAVPTTTTLSVTPGKGIMVGAMVTIKDANGNALGNSATANTGIASVAIPNTATGPFIVAVSCPTACSYFDEKTLAMVNGSPTTPDLLAVVPSAGITNIGVTAATHSAAQYAIAAGTLTSTSVTAANNTVIAQLGFAAGTDILTPPRIISDAASLALAQAGTAPADVLANYSAALAQAAASGVSAIQVIADYGNAWKQAALVPASGVIMPTSIDPAIVAQNAPTFVVTTIPNVASAVAAQTQLVASAVAVTSHFFADASALGGGLREWYPSYTAASGVTPDVINIHTLVSTGTNSYAGTSTYKENAVNGWIALDKTAYAPDSYVLTAAGWQMYDQADSFVNNLNGTVTSNSRRGLVTETVSETDLATQPIVCTDANAVVVTCAAPGNYPTGARSYSGMGGVASKDDYRIYPSDSYWSNTVTNVNGVVLTALPVLGTDSFCSNGAVLMPLTNPATGADNYAVSWTASGACVSLEIATVTAAGTTGLVDTVNLSSKSTGIAGVTVGIAKAAPTSNVAWMNNSIFAVVNGKVMEGDLRRAGKSASHVFYMNKVAQDAELVANGLPLSNVAGTASPVTPTPTTGLAANASLLVDAQVGIVKWDGSNGNASARIVNIASTATVGTYTITNVSKALTAQGWVDSSTPPAGVTNTSYELFPTGWAAQTTSTVVDNGTSMSYPFGTMSVAKTDLSGTAVTCGNPQGSAPVGVIVNSGWPWAVTIGSATCAQSATYPANSTLYTMTDNQTSPIYNLNDTVGTGITPIVLTNASGTPLTSLPTLTSTFCLSNNNGPNMTVYVPIANPVAGPDNYNMHGAAACDVGSINAAIATPAYGTVLVTMPNTGVAGVAVAEVTSATGGWSYILAYHLNKWMQGWVGPAGTYTTYFVNKVAADAQLPANGLPVLP